MTCTPHPFRCALLSRQAPALAEFTLHCVVCVAEGRRLELHTLAGAHRFPTEHGPCPFDLPVFVFLRGERKCRPPWPSLTTHCFQNRSRGRPGTFSSSVVDASFYVAANGKRYICEQSGCRTQRNRIWSSTCAANAPCSWGNLSGWRESNSQFSVPKTDGLPTSLHPDVLIGHQDSNLELTLSKNADLPVDLCPNSWANEGTRTLSDCFTNSRAEPLHYERHESSRKGSNLRLSLIKQTRCHCATRG